MCVDDEGSDKSVESSVKLSNSSLKVFSCLILLQLFLISSSFLGVASNFRAFSFISK